MGVINNLIDNINSTYSYLSENISEYVFSGIKLFLFAFLIVLIVYIIWKFYSNISKRNFIMLNLGQYNTYEHPTARKFFAVLFYFIEYILIMPALILLWFIALSAVLLLIALGRDINQILIISGAIVMAVRIFAYGSEEVSKELAKLFPLIALSVFLLAPGAFDLPDILNKLKELPLLFNSAVFYFVMILLLEIILRVVYTIVELAKGKEEVGEEG